MIVVIVMFTVKVVVFLAVAAPLCAFTLRTCIAPVKTS